MNLIPIICILGIIIEPNTLKKTEEIINTAEGYKLTAIIPAECEEPEDSTIVYFGYTPNEFVIYLKNWQKEISVSSKRRDAEGLGNQQEDCVFILLASNGKGKDYYMIGVNPFGAIYDCMISDNGSFVQWDGDIKADVSIENWGWVALISIPFSAVNYSNTLWGIQIFKIIFNKMEIQVLSKTKNISNLQDACDLKVDFNYIKSKEKTSLLFIPSGRIERIIAANTEFIKKIGLTGRLRKGTGELVEITLFPDYSEVDVDVQDFSLERLPLNYPEKRPFFVEGGSFYQTPITLIRTRNLILPQYGLKFYSTTNKSGFITFFLDDSALKNISFTRFTYTPLNNLTLGSFGIISENNYDLISGDIFYYLKSLTTNFQGQVSKNLTNLSRLSYISITREEKPGMSLAGNYLEIDSNFISDLNTISIHFDGIKKLNGACKMTFFPKFSNYQIYVNGGIKYSKMVDKYNGDRLIQQGDFSFLIGPIPIILLFGGNIAELNYLNLENNNIEVYTVGIQYLGETWKSSTFYYSFGDYLGGSIEQYFGEIKYSFIKRLNLGGSFLKVKSTLDDFLMYQTFGEISLVIKSFFLKPYINYTIDYFTAQKNLTLNGVLLYEPKYMTGIYLAFSKKIECENNEWVSRFEKLLLKIQCGLNLNL